MIKLKFIISTIVLFLGMNAGLWAQQDSTAVNDTVGGKKFFNALDYSMQKRYRPENNPACCTQYFAINVNKCNKNYNL